jgi:phage portal protein BeeE
LVPTGHSCKYLQFLENRKFSTTEICAAFGVPEEIITTTNAAKYDVMAGAHSKYGIRLPCSPCPPHT